MRIVFVGIKLISLWLYKWILIYTYIVYSIQKKTCSKKVARLKEEAQILSTFGSMK